jgi:hypothetical protein
MWEKWNMTHQCASSIQLNVLQEVWDLFEQADSEAAVTCKEDPKTLKIRGSIQNIEILVLIDSGSSNSFISEQVSELLTGVSYSPKPTNVRVANGKIIQYAAEILNVEWYLQGHVFCSHLKVLALQNFDMVIGMDWLEKHSPMRVHWTQKWLTIPYYNSQLTLQGIITGVLNCQMIELMQLQSVSPAGETEEVPEVVQQLLSKFQDVFTTSTTLLPRRHCDHTIPLIPGASHVYSRPHRYAPALKDEIEKQVTEML